MKPSAQFWGTCGVCLGVFKVERKATSRHGFQRPGVGYIFGKCFGEEMVAWELSPESAKRFLAEVLVPLHKEAIACLAMFDNGKIVWIKRPLSQTFLQRRNKEPIEYETITPEHRDWQREFSSRRWQAESKIRQIESDIKHYKKRIADWKEKPLTPVDAAHPQSKKEKTFRVVEKFRTVSEDGGPDLDAPIMAYAPGDDPFTPGAKSRMISTGRFWSKTVKRKIPFYVAEDAVSGRKVGMGKTPEEAEFQALSKGYKLVL